MTKILHIDTTTDICSVAISENENILREKNSGNERSHAVQLAVFIDEILKQSKLTINDIDAVAISKGPGSYTGLRIGVSTAKGLCFGANKPLISVHTLQAMTAGIPTTFIEAHCPDDYFFCPMLDARRMEVYSAIFDKHGDFVRDVKAEVIDENSFAEYLDKKKIIFLGDGAEKTKSIIKHPNAIYFDDFKHIAANMVQFAVEKYKTSDFEDVAYFEPFYLKDFVTTTSKKNILGL